MSINYDLSDLLRDVSECWVALDPEQSRVIGRGETIAEAEAEAHEHGIAEPVVLWAPKKWIANIYPVKTHA